MNRRRWLVATLGAGSGALALVRCARSHGIAEPDDTGAAPFRSPPATGVHEFRLAIDAASPGPAVNRLLLGTNVQWTDGGDGLLNSDGGWRMALIDKVLALRPTVARFPGGAQSDQYHWARGIGGANARGENRQSHSGRLQATLMGTQEFLELCEATDALPFITVNVVTGGVEEAADWLRVTNVQRLYSRITGRLLPRVAYWEIGNEPYLKEDDSAYWLNPAQYVARANAFIKALRAVDPDIRIGVPLRTDHIGGVPATPYPGYAREVLAGVTERVDFFSQHNAYLPYAYDQVPSDEILYWATMAATATVSRNLDDARALIAAARPGQSIRQALTEYSALFTLGKGDTDAFIASPLGAVYLVDLLAMLARRDDIELAQHWSLSGNFKFGAIASEGFERPAFLALRLMDSALRGRRIADTLACETFVSPRAGLAAPQPAVPLVASLATVDGKTLRVLLINKDRARRARGEIRVAGGDLRGASAEHLSTDALLRTPDAPGAMTRTTSTPSVSRQTVHIELAPCSVCLVTLDLRG